MITSIKEECSECGGIKHCVLLRHIDRTARVVCFECKDDVIESFICTDCGIELDLIAVDIELSESKNRTICEPCGEKYQCH